MTNYYENPPEYLIVDGEKYIIDTDFRRWIEFQSIVLSDLSEEDKTENIINFIYKMGLPAKKSSFDAMIEFYIGGNKESSQESGGNVRVFDFEQDSEYIFPAFFESYSIDLTQVKIHWWKFKALFKSLPESCEICKIMHYRIVNLNDVPKSQRKHYAKMKQVFALNNANTRGKTLREHVEELKRKQEENKMSILRSDKQSDNDN